MRSDKFAVLQAEFETTAKRLKETGDRSERKILLSELRETLSKLDTVIEEPEDPAASLIYPRE